MLVTGLLAIATLCCVAAVACLWVGEQRVGAQATAMEAWHTKLIALAAIFMVGAAFYL